MGDGQAPGLQQFSVKDTVALMRKRENMKQMKVENSKEQRMQKASQESRGRRGKYQRCLKEERTFSPGKGTPGQDDLVVSAAQTSKPVRTRSREKPSKKKGRVLRPRGAGDGTKLALGGREVVPEEGALLALPTSTLEEGDGTGVETSQGKEVEKGKSKQKKNKEGKAEEKRPKGLEEAPAGGCGRRTKALIPEKGHRDRQAVREDASRRRRRRPRERGGGPGAREEGVLSGDRETGAKNCRQEPQTVDAEPATTRREKLADATQAEGLMERKQIRDADTEEGRNTWVEKIKEEENEKFGGDPKEGEKIQSNTSESKAVVSRKDQKRKPGTAAGDGAREAKARRAGGAEPESEAQTGGTVKGEGVPTAGLPRRKTGQENKVQKEKDRCVQKQGGGRARVKMEELVGAKLSRGRGDNPSTRLEKEGASGRWRW